MLRDERIRWRTYRRNYTNQRSSQLNLYLSVEFSAFSRPPDFTSPFGWSANVSGEGRDFQMNQRLVGTILSDNPRRREERSVPWRDATYELANRFRRDKGFRLAAGLRSREIVTTIHSLFP